MLQRAAVVVALALAPRGANAQAAPPVLPTTSATRPDSVTALSASEEDRIAPFVAGFRDDTFVLSDGAHRFVLAPTGRLQVDGVAFTGDRITQDTTAPSFHRADVKDGIVLRRARIEVAGAFFDRFTFLLGAEFTSTRPPVGADLFVDARIHPLLHVQLGQFDAPFTMENRTWDTYTDFQERSLAVRDLGIPTNKEIGLMVWGETPSRTVAYAVGVFDGDGPNRTNPDGYFDAIGRVFGHPLITLGGPLRDLQIGASFRYGFRGGGVDYAYPAMSTQSQYVFFDPVLVSGSTPVTLVPDSHQIAGAGEVDLPFGPFDARGEFVYVHNGTAEVPGAALAAPAQRLGTLSGVGWYAQFGFWAWGTPFVNGRPGYELPLHVRWNAVDARPAQGLQLLLRVEGLDVRYQGGARGSVLGSTQTGAERDGQYRVFAAALGVNYWATRHVRFTLDYFQYFFPDQPGAVAMPDDNLAHGPNHNAFTFGELSTRVGLVL